MPSVLLLLLSGLHPVRCLHIIHFADTERDTERASLHLENHPQQSVGQFAVGPSQTPWVKHRERRKTARKRLNRSTGIMAQYLTALATLWPASDFVAPNPARDAPDYLLVRVSPAANRCLPFLSGAVTCTTRHSPLRPPTSAWLPALR
ncbi:hypothetical protein BKA56DRAFT_299458 [Ilyonectria sp. MPI-CAGE-AT-0026]|nr:hypothetical protein BKA56DRAFT_299458 [Ilyonectria sp. MPI-CAGE-AT-0026]